MSPSVDLVRQKLFGHYEILARLGSGGMGDVYRAKDLTLGRPVAIKVLREPLATDRDRLSRFEQEARSASALNHPNIVTIYEIGSVGVTPYIAMELVEGKTLREILISGPLLTRRALQLAAQAADGLAQAHAAGIVHRDLKPENLIVTSDGRVKILDFGLAKLVVPPIAEDASTGSLYSPGTEPGVILGTVGYMSPEQARGLPVDFRSDQFSCGSILYEMSTGKPAFRRESAVQTLAAIIEDEPEPIADLNPSVPPPLRWIIERCLAKDAERRYGSTRDLQRDLGDVLDHLAEVSSGPSRPTRALRPDRSRLVIGALVVLGSVAAGALWMALPPTPSPSRSESAAAPIKARRSVAVLGFKNLSGRPEAAWLSTALAEMLTTELAAGGKLRTIPGENVGRMKIELSLSDAESFARDTLAKVGKNLGADMVLLGSYVLLPGDQIRLDLRLQDVAAGEMVTALGESGTEAGLVDLVTRAGSRLRQSIGAGEPAASDAGGVKAGAPSNLEAQRLYAEGLAKLRVLDALAAQDLLQKAVAADPSSPMAHSALADAWSKLGHDAKAKAEAKSAFDLSAGLSREERLSVEGRYREMGREWAKAIEIQRALVAFFPDDLEYGLRLAAVQTAAGNGNAALATLEEMRQGPASSADPRIDLAEAVVAQSLGDFKREAAAAARAAEKGAAQGARLLLARARLFEAYALDRLGDVAKAATAADDARKIYGEAGDKEGVASALHEIGSLSWVRGDIVAAQERWLEALAIRRQIGYDHGVASSLSNLGLVLWEQGDLAGAEKKLEEARAIDRELGDRAMIGIDLDNISAVRYEQGDLDGARKAAEQALALCREVGERTEAAIVLKRLAAVLLAEGDVAGARAKYQEALPVLRETGAKDFAADVLFAEGELLEVEGDLAAARKRHEEALAIRTTLGDRLAVAKSQVALARLSIEEGRPKEAESPLRAALEVFAARRVSDGEASGHVVLARSLLDQGSAAEAASAMQRADTLSRRSQSPHVRLQAAAALARARASNGGAAEALRGLEAALVEARRLRLVGVQFEIRLAQAEIESGAGSVRGRELLQALAKDAEAKGFGLIAGKATAVLTSTGARPSS